MLRTLRGGARSGRQSPAAKIVALLLVFGLVAAASPFVVQLVVWVLSVL